MSSSELDARHGGNNRMASKAVPRILKLVPFVLPLAAAILIIIVLVAGSYSAAPPNLYLLKASLIPPPSTQTNPTSHGSSNQGIG